MTKLEQIIQEIEEMKTGHGLGEREICAVCLTRVIKKLRKNAREKKNI